MAVMPDGDGEERRRERERERKKKLSRALVTREEAESALPEDSNRSK